MNVIAVMSDEHSYNMMQFLKPGLLRTPNLDRLAAQSTVFTNCYTPCPVCAPARAAFITGRYVNRLGTWDNSTPYDGTVPGLPKLLKEHGRRFACIGKTHFHHLGDYDFTWAEECGYMRKPDIGSFFRDRKIGRLGAEKRFERIGIRPDDEEKFDDRVLQKSLAWLEAHGAEEDWVLYVGFLDPHFPFCVKQRHWDYYAEKIKSVPQALRPPFSSLNEPLDWLRTYFKCHEVPEETVLKLLIGYCCAIEELDERMGRLLAKLDELGLTDKTAFLYTSDHGEQMGYHGLWWKCTMFEESVHVPLLVRVPGIRPQRLAAPVNLVDIFPTICAWQGVPVPADVDGHSLLPLLEQGEDRMRPDFAFSEYHAHGMPRGMFMIRFRQYKYVYYCTGDEQLFDLAKDPGEDRDLLAGVRFSPEGDVLPGGGLSETLQAVRLACRERLYRVCDPHEVDLRAREYQARLREVLGIGAYSSEKGERVPFPENVLGYPMRKND